MAIIFEREGWGGLGLGRHGCRSNSGFSMHLFKLNDSNKKKKHKDFELFLEVHIFSPNV